MEQLRAQIEFAGNADAEGDTPKRRRFRMVGYTGAKVRGGKLAFEAAGFKHRKKVPILLQHDPERRAGYADVIEVRDGSLHLEGYLLSNKVGREIASDSDEGFPFEASVGLGDVEWEHLDRGETAELNGETVTGPLSIGRRARLSEVSFVTSGADSNTEAVALESRGTTLNDEATAMEIEKLKAEHEAALAARDQQLTAAQAEITALSARLEGAEAKLAAHAEAEKARKEAEAAAYVEKLQSDAVNLQSPIPADDVAKVEAAFARGDEDTARTLGAAFLARSEALGAAAAAPGREVALGASANDPDSYLAAQLAAEGIDPANPRRLAQL